jgi:DNA gyrase/topoisomerase IV subunit A
MQRRQAKGKAIVNLVNMSKDEKIADIVSVKEFDTDRYIVMATRDGIVKKTALSEYSNPRSSASISASETTSASADETAIIRTFTFGVSSGNDVKTSGRFYETTNFFQKDSFAFENTLQTKDFVGCKVDFVKKQYGTSLKSFNHRTVVPNSITVHETETTDEIVFIGFDCNVNTN